MTPIKVTLPVTVTASARLDATSLKPGASGKFKASLGVSASQNVWTIYGTDDSSVVLAGVPASFGVYNCGTLGPASTGNDEPEGAASISVPAYSYYFFYLPTIVDAIATQACIAGETDAGNSGGGGSVSGALAIANLAAGGVLGTAAATVDSYLAANLAQTTAGQTVWPPDPTDTAADHFFELGNTGSVAVLVAVSSAATKYRSLQPNDQTRMTWQGAGEGWAFDGTFANGGNATGAAQVIGSLDAQDVTIIVNGNNPVDLNANGNSTFGSGTAGDTTLVRGPGGVTLKGHAGGVIINADATANVSIGPAAVAAAAGSALDVQSVSGGLFAPRMTGAQFNALATNLPPHLIAANITDQDTTGQLVVNVGTAANPARGVAGAQHGTTTLIAGTTALIPAHISATSSIVCTVKTSVPGAGNLTVEYSALDTDRVVGESGAGGGFKLTALNAAGTINVVDLSTLNWIIVG